MTGQTDSPARQGARAARVLLLAALGLALASTAVLVLSDSVRWMRLGVVAALWAALAGAFLAARYRRQVTDRADEAAELQQVYELELEREVAARREFELEVETETRRKVEQETRDDLTALREELKSLRQNLEMLLGGEVLVERFALHAEATRMRAVAEDRAIPNRPGTPVRRITAGRTGDPQTEFIERVNRPEGWADEEEIDPNWTPSWEGGQRPRTPVRAAGKARVATSRPAARPQQVTSQAQRNGAAPARGPQVSQEFPPVAPRREPGGRINQVPNPAARPAAEPVVQPGQQAVRQQSAQAAQQKRPEAKPAQPVAQQPMQSQQLPQQAPSAQTSSAQTPAAQPVRRPDPQHGHSREMPIPAAQRRNLADHSAEHRVPVADHRAQGPEHRVAGPAVAAPRVQTPDHQQAAADHRAAGHRGPAEPQNPAADNRSTVVERRDPAESRAGGHRGPTAERPAPAAATGDHRMPEQAPPRPVPGSVQRDAGRAPQPPTPGSVQRDPQPEPGGRRRAPTGTFPPVAPPQSTGRRARPEESEAAGKRHRPEGAPTWQETLGGEDTGSHSSGKSVSELLAAHGTTQAPRRHRRRSED
ncbi:DUF6779 domain-containing protein [Actinokineospora enzanensis]|uniref:DUF6779 domain-containing protein n=1 Tax=Actinokineospora enzanensis TaxID=155975 RepID=UPI0003691495|nr:DUF6779 domain-containing protein [Actinokineospora enzanensis]